MTDKHRVGSTPSELREAIDRIFDDFYRDVLKSPDDASAASRHRQTEVLDAVIASLPLANKPGTQWSNGFLGGRANYQRDVRELLQSAKSTSKESE